MHPRVLLSRRQMKWFANAYSGGGPPQSGPYLAPLEADLRRLAPALLVVGTLDPLFSDSELFAAALQKAGVPADPLVYEDGIQAFLQIPMFDIPRDVLGKIAAFCHRHLEP